jgi:RimJ/RimL family protein N-acetyltransferase
MVGRRTGCPAADGGPSAIRYAGGRRTGHDGVMEAPQITTGRLRLRPWRVEDVPAVTAACQDPETQRWIPLPAPYEQQHAREFVDRHTAARWAEGTAASLAVTDAGTDGVLASIGLHRDKHPDDTANAEVGFWCAPWARGRGVMAEATVALARWAFAECEVQRLEWLAMVGNNGSRRVAEKAGFTMEGTLRAFLVHRGVRSDAWIGSLLPADLG